jgi:hypothetical protein
MDNFVDGVDPKHARQEPRRVPRDAPNKAIVVARFAAQMDTFARMRAIRSRKP